MKLKKIASLMLAGVMAISMLAGCSTTTTTPDEGDDNAVVTPAAGYSATFANALTGAAAVKGKINMSDSAELTSALNSAIRHLSSSTMTKFFTAPGGSESIDLAGSSFGRLLDVDQMIDVMGAVSQWNAFRDLVPPVSLSDEDAWKDETVTMLFAVDGAVDEYAAVEQIAKLLNGDIGRLYIDNDSTPDLNRGVDHTTLSYTYNGSVSVASKTWVDNSTVGVHIIAVQITRVANA